MATSVHTPKHHLHIIHPAAAIAWKTGPRLQTDKVLWLHFPGLDPACSPDTQTVIQISSSSSSRVLQQIHIRSYLRIERVTPSVKNQLLENLELARVRFVAVISSSATDWPLRTHPLHGP